MASTVWLIIIIIYTYHPNMTSLGGRGTACIGRRAHDIIVYTLSACGHVLVKNELHISLTPGSLTSYMCILLADHMVRSGPMDLYINPTASSCIKHNTGKVVLVQIFGLADTFVHLPSIFMATTL